MILYCRQVSSPGGHYGSAFSLEACGSVLPALVMEALAVGERGMSATVSETGWAWLVKGRKVGIC